MRHMGGTGKKAAGVDPEIKEANQKRLRRIEGQVRGLQKMVEEDRYCADVIMQIASVQEALRGVARNLMKNHMRHCATKAIASGKNEEKEAMYAGAPHSIGGMNAASAEPIKKSDASGGDFAENGRLQKAGPTTPSEARIRYTCPMHPEVVQTGPGSCPKCGMALEPMDVVAVAGPDPEYVSMRLRFCVSAALSLPVLLLGMFGEKFGFGVSTAAMRWIEFVLATPVVAWGGWPFFERFWASIVNRSPNMFTLIGLGTGAAYLESATATIFPWWFPKSFAEMNGAVPVYFEAAAVITTLVLLGQVMELGARAKTAGAIRELLHLSPQVGHQIDRTGRA